MENFKEIKKRFDAFWAGEKLETPIVAITAPKKKYELPKPESMEQRWLDADFRIRVSDIIRENTYYTGDAFPMDWCNVGPGALAGFMGSKVSYSDYTVWFDSTPLLKNWDDMDKLRLGCDFYDKVLSYVEKVASHSKNRYITGMTDIGGILDVAAALRGTNQLLLDLYDDPDKVKELIKIVHKFWCEAFNKIHSIISPTQVGTSAWMGLWSRERFYNIQCDFSAMISPAQFEEFVKPTLIKECDFFEHTIYHLDGPGELPHIDHLLDIENLNGIQWVQGAGQPPKGDDIWFPYYDKIQKSGKRLVLTHVNANEVEKLLKNLSKDGLYISTMCNNVEDAKLLAYNIKNWI